MKYSFLLIAVLSVLTLSACADYGSDQKRGWLFGAFAPKSWPERHWEGDTFGNNIGDSTDSLPEAIDVSLSMFDIEDLETMSPTDFINNLKNADIINSAYRDNGMFSSIMRNRSDKGEMIVELDYNFYALSQADKVVIADLLYQSYGDELLTLRDTHTDKIVGHITSEGLTIF